MSLSASLFGRDSLIFKATNVLGLGLPGVLDKEFGPKDPDPQRLGELSAQTAKESEPRAIIWGRVRPIGGNIIHCQEPIKRMVKESTQGGGKGGGGKKETKVEHVFRTYAIGVCEGPITSFSRIWRNNKLVYDARGNEWGDVNNPVFLQAYRLYLGGWDQMPSPDLEAIWGVGNVPAYRGTAYIVAIDEDLTEMSGAVPQFQFEVERAEGFSLTSRVYPGEVIEAVESTPAKADAPWQGFTEALGSSGLSLEAGSLRDTLKKSSYLEALETSGLSIESGELRQTLKQYVVPPEGVSSSGMAIQSGELRRTLISYLNYAPEGISSSGVSVTSGTLS
ncbi:hypothetical protein IFR09_11330 [Pseudomonas syringae]|nr:hypothetical protein [Pseudomonas syringae]MBD8801893.1 hypothetical protein [Pseudomonas syringae]MBD8811757.1 hypothetical protein [Pseudomonas syringae]